MEAQQEGQWVFIFVALALPLLFYLFFKMMTAKTRKAYFTNMALFVVIMLGLMTLFAKSGLMPSAEELREHQVEAPVPGKALSTIPTPVIVVIAIIGVVWIGGGNWIMIRQARKSGRPWWDPFNPLTPVGRNMDRGAWLKMILLMFFVLVLMSVGFDLVQPMMQ